MRVFDACALLYDKECWRSYLHRFIEPAPEYLKVFAPAFCRFFNVDKERYLSLLMQDAFRAVEFLVNKYDVELDMIIPERRKNGIVGEFIMGSPQPTFDGLTVNEKLLISAVNSPGAQVWVGLPLGRPKLAVEIIETSLKRGASGANIIPFLDQVDVLDCSLSPIFSALSEAGLPTWIHTGHHFASRFPQGADSWRKIDELALRFPDLKIVMGHAGWPNVLESILVTSRHENVYLEFSSHRAKSILNRPEWFGLRNATLAPTRYKILFGTSTWVNSRPAHVLAAELNILNLPLGVLNDWVFNNAVSLTNGIRR